MNADFDYSLLVSKIRQVRDLTQEQLAHELGVTFGTVNGWENGKHQPSPLAARELLKLARDAGIDVTELPGATRRRGASATKARSSAKSMRKSKGKHRGKAR